MVTAEMYKNYLSSYGSNLAQVKKNQSDAIMNNSFTADAQYFNKRWMEMGRC